MKILGRFGFLTKPYNLDFFDLTNTLTKVNLNLDLRAKYDVISCNATKLSYI
jgi:hypothetical protein